MAAPILAAVLAAFGAHAAEHDPTATTMLSMRLAGGVLENYRRMDGRFPSPDGRLIPLREALRGSGLEVTRGAPVDDAWGRPLLYRATSCCYRLVSLGADGAADVDHAAAPLHPSALVEITDASGRGADLVMVNGRFTARPFGRSRAAFESVNAIARIAVAMFSYAIDHNRYAGESATFLPISRIADELAPVYLPDVPTRDGWGNPILFFSTGTAFGLASLGADGQADRVYLTDLPAGIPWDDGGPSPAVGADLVFSNGRFSHWPAGVEP